MNKLDILVIIPAKMDSVRFPGKNMHLINGKPMLDYSLQYALESDHYTHIVVSSEDVGVGEYIQDRWPTINFLTREDYLCGDTEVVDVYIEVANQFFENQFDLVVCLQPDNLGRVTPMDDYIEYMIANKYDDLVTVNTNFKRTGELRIFKFDELRNGCVSKRIGARLGFADDIHYESDLDNIKNKL